MFIAENYTPDTIKAERNRTCIGVRVSLSGSRLVLTGDVTGEANKHAHRLGFKLTSPAFKDVVFERKVNKAELDAIIPELDKLALVFADDALAAYANAILD